MPHLADRYPQRILIADDNTVNQRVAAALLEKMGYRVQCAGNGQEALDAIGRTAIDVILMDVQMPVMDALEATRRICQIPADNRPWVIALRANATGEDRQETFAAGMNDYLSKPIRPAELSRALAHA